MGNETSVPEDDGLQPPSQIPPGGQQQQPPVRKALKVAKAVLQKATDRVDSNSTASDDQFYPAVQDVVFSPPSRMKPGDGNPTIPVMFTSERSNGSKETSSTSANNNSTGNAFNNSSGNAFNNSSALAAAGTAAAATTTQAVTSIRTGGKAVRNGGRALINSMRNLTVNTTTAPGASPNPKVPPSTTSSFRAESEWESRWDADDDDESDEDEDEQGAPAKHPMVPLRAASAAAVPSVHQQPPDLLSAPPPPPSILSLPSLQQQRDITTAVHLKPKIPVYEKPNVQMFLPLLRVLGKGSFGKVVLCQKRVGEEKGTMFAMKILRKTHLAARRQIERTRTERKVLSVVDHPFIMKLHFAFQTEDKLYLVLDYCPGGELFFHLSRFRRFPERVARFYTAELLLAIGHLHKRGIIYRDLKPENVLLDADGHVKLGDFGLAKAGIRHPCEGATSMCGTPEYMAPEVLSQQGHGFCVDYWGLGMLTYEMMTGLPPWYTTDRAKLFRRLKSAPLDIPNYFSSHAASIVDMLLQRDPRRRLGATGIRNAMEHDFFQTLNWRALYARRIAAPIHPCEGWDPKSAGLNANENDAALDAATANFDNAFTRMKVDSDGGGGGSDVSSTPELHEHTFVGFTFDVEQPDGPRQRSHHFQN